MANGFLLIALGLLVLYIGISGKFDCLSTAFSCFFSSKEAQSSGLTGSSFGSVLGGAAKGAATRVIDRIPKDIGSIITRRTGGGGIQI